MFGKLIGLCFIAQIVDGNSAAQVDVFERVAGLAVQRDEMFPHGFEGFGERLNVRRLRADVNVYATDVNEFRMEKRTTEGVEHIGVGDAEL